MLTAHCACGRKCSYRVEQAGKTVICPACAATIRLPVALQAARPPAQTVPSQQPAQSEETELELEIPVEPPSGPANPPLARQGDAAVPAQPEALAPQPLVSAAPADEAAETAPFRALLRSAFKYPFSPDGIAALSIATATFVVGYYLLFIGRKIMILDAIVPQLVPLVLAGLMSGFLMEIMRASAEGEDGMPPWPNMADYRENILMPLVYMALPAAISVGGALLYFYLVNYVGELLGVGWIAYHEYIFMPLLLVGLIYLPMGVLAMALGKDTRFAKPLPVVRAIVRVRAEYAGVWVLFALSAAVYRFGDLLTRFVPVVPVLVQQAVTVYLAIVGARMMGLLYFTAKDRFGDLVD